MLRMRNNKTTKILKNNNNKSKYAESNSVKPSSYKGSGKNLAKASTAEIEKKRGKNLVDFNM